MCNAVTVSTSATDSAVYLPDITGQRRGERHKDGTFFPYLVTVIMYYGGTVDSLKYISLYFLG